MNDRQNSIKRMIIVVPTILLLSLLFVLPLSAQGMGGDNNEVLGVLIIGAIVLALPIILGWASFVLIWRGLFPRKVEWTGEIIRRLPWGSFWLGLASTVLMLIIFGVLANAGSVLPVLGILILVAFILLFASSGQTALVEMMGEYIDPASAGVRRAILGTCSLYFLILIPVGGWLLLLGVGMMGIGGGVMSWFLQPGKSVDEQEIPESTVIEPNA